MPHAVPQTHSQRPRSQHSQSHRPPRTLMLVGIALLIGVVLMIKYQVQSNPPPATSLAQFTSGQHELPETQLNHLLDEGRPTLAFFRSNTCVRCIEMTRTIAQVFPEFATTVSLVDVDVYDQRNAALIQKVGIQVIPTLIFFDHTGAGQVVAGGMPADELRTELQELAQGVADAY